MYQRATIFMIVFLLVSSGCGAPAAPSPTPTEQEVELTTVASPTSLPSPVPTDTPIPWPTATPTSRPIGWVVEETAHSPVPRTGHAMTMLPDGRVLLFGGMDESGNALGDTWILDPSAGAQSSASGFPGLLSIIRRPLMADWTPITPPDSSAARQGHSMVTLPDGRVMLFGGSDTQGAWFNDLYVFTGDTWSAITPANDPPSARANHNAWVRNDKMYVSGGNGPQGLCNDLWLYDLQSNTWRELPNPPDMSLYAYPIIQDDMAYLVDVHNGRLFFFNMANEQWEQQEISGDWPGRQRSGYTMVQVDSSAYMMGGADWDSGTQTLNPSAEVWRFDFTTFIWTQLENMPYPISHGGKAVYDPRQKRIILWGGEQSEGVLVPGNRTLIYYLGP